MSARQITTWLKENTNLSWARTGGDTPAVRQDRIYINRSEGYEIRDFLLKYYEKCDLEHKDQNYAISWKRIKTYKPGQKVKTIDLLTYLAKDH